MKNILILALVLLAPAGAALAQAPVVTGVLPLANARAVPRTGAITVSFSQPLLPGAEAALQVFGTQRGGRRTGATPATRSGSTLTFSPSAHAYLPGETMEYSVTGAASSGGLLAQPWVGQFTAAVGGSGRGTFVAGTDAVGLTFPLAVVLGDVDNDNDLDLLIVNSRNDFASGLISIRLNNGQGVFTNGSGVAMMGTPLAITLGDVDSDGDLDFASANANYSAVSIRLNNGRGTFSGTQDVWVGTTPRAVTFGDVDGDGDLDLLTGNGYGGTTVGVRLNNGSGVFTGTQNVNMGSGGCNDVALGDVNNDGSLDLVATSDLGTVAVRFNNGAGVFSGTQAIAVGPNPHGLALGDLDGDGDLDLATASQTNNTATLALNNGSGTFTANPAFPVDTTPTDTVLGDIDADGDLDLLITSSYINSGLNGSITPYLNNGSASFTRLPSIIVGRLPQGLALGDVDADGDLDAVTANTLTSGTASVRLNGGVGLGTNSARPTLALLAYPNPAHRSIAVENAVAHTSIVLLDALGRTLLTAPAAADGSARLSLPATLPAGVYVLRNGSQQQRLLVE